MVVYKCVGCLVCEKLSSEWSLGVAIYYWLVHLCILYANMENDSKVGKLC